VLKRIPASVPLGRTTAQVVSSTNYFVRRAAALLDGTS
jgi:hypothetical protein